MALFFPTLRTDSRTSRRAGFTIVELLIVIVVIAILAVISIVAYKGIQDRAKNSAFQSAMTTVEKGLKMYYIDHGSYPVPTDINGGVGTIDVCIGEQTSYPATTIFSAGACATADVATSAVNTASYSAVVSAALKEKLSAIPATAQYTTTLASYGSVRGIVYKYLATNTVSLTYVLAGNQTCGRYAKAYIEEVGVTQCMLTLDTTTTP